MSRTKYVENDVRRFLKAKSHVRIHGTNDWGRIVHRVRRGCGGLKQITVKSLWVQEAIRGNCLIEM